MVSRIWEIYENFSEIVYVADMKTYQLIYMNKKARELFNIPSLEDVKKQLCYKVLQNSSSPCSMCTNDKIAEGCFYEWYYFNPVIQTSYSLKDTIIEDSGRRYRMEIAINISDQEKQKKTLDVAMNNETLINEALKYALAEPDPEKSINVLMEYVGKALQGERSYIFEQHGDFCDNTYEWCAAGVVPQKENLQNVTLEDLSAWYSQFKDHNLIIIEEIESYKEKSPVLYDILKPQGIHSLVVAPLMSQGKIIGFFGIDNPPASLVSYVYNILVLLGQFIVSLLNRRDLFQQLRVLSFYDQLTGACNRHALDRVLLHYKKEQSAGVLYADVMGLKAVNDTLGHSVGDKMLIDAYCLLNDQFDSQDIYRVGGDEFLVIAFDEQKEEFLSKIEKLRTRMNAGKVHMAIGSVWTETLQDKELSKIIKVADEEMYKEKRQIYRQSSQYDRRRKD